MSILVIVSLVTANIFLFFHLLIDIVFVKHPIHLYHFKTLSNCNSSVSELSWQVKKQITGPFYMQLSCVLLQSIACINELARLKIRSQ